MGQRAGTRAWFCGWRARPGSSTSREWPCSSSPGAPTTAGASTPRRTKEGRFMFAVLAAAAEYELELHAERQAEGIAAAKRREATGAMLSGKKKTGRPRRAGHATPPGRRRCLGRRGRPHAQNRPFHRLRGTRGTLTSNYPTRIPLLPWGAPARSFSSITAVRRFLNPGPRIIGDPRSRNGSRADSTA
ncbi:recombinase family protein [Streptosporangium sp. NPDC049644]|uniref:recombinase family protein n=1 Tax=Streptosporangium sp. NPDC049644 TaxID=3155507 RepID=UPI00344A915C